MRLDTSLTCRTQKSNLLLQIQVPFKNRYIVGKKVFYQGKKFIVDPAVGVPAFRLWDSILVLSREPAGERRVGGAPARVCPAGWEKWILYSTNICLFMILLEVTGFPKLGQVCWVGIHSVPAYLFIFKLVYISLSFMLDCLNFVIIYHLIAFIISKFSFFF